MPFQRRPARHPLVVLFAILIGVTAVISCSPGVKLLLSGGEKVRNLPHAPPNGPLVLIFAFDGVGYHELGKALESGSAPNLEKLLGRSRGEGLYEHAWSAPNAISILPSTTIAAWSSIFTGAPPAYHGVPGNEWFVREEMRFYAPAPVSVTETDDTRRMVTEDLVGKALRTPTLFEQAGVRAYVSLNPVYRRADIFTTIDPIAFVSLMADFVHGEVMERNSLKRDAYAELDENSVPKLIDAINTYGLPAIQVVYFPGIDLYTHLAKDALASQVEYLETITDPAVGLVLDTYRAAGVLDRTYVLIIADHGHTPVLKENALGSEGTDTPAALLRATGFRTRKFKLEPGPDEQDYQAAFAYQGAMAYVYLADRSTCAAAGQKCDWSKPPRFGAEVMPAVRAFDYVNRTGTPIPRLKGTLDLIFARGQSPPGRQPLRPFEIFDGKKLVPIYAYLKVHPRPDLLKLNERMRWLGVGPYGNRAGDIVLLSRSGLTIPIEKRFYFSGPYRSWHGSPSAQDSHIPLVLACQGKDGKDLRDLVGRVTGSQPSQLDVTPLVRAILGR
jgi:hypothetical protein